jgi:hypothetical protein
MNKYKCQWGTQQRNCLYAQASFVSDGDGRRSTKQANALNLVLKTQSLTACKVEKSSIRAENLRQEASQP